ncbi:hypothetical protein [Clostridium kluyveri]|uniref:hypothetical protein n=1 Tax=Clostridium kluyveri TaxID=1534 RepID=UPI0022483EA2|nr:hypothetical protein [Clostridium kluyveri]UZQ50210.1 hypothetical protein OP486_20090 [Clostridium kluyveri]
MNNISWCNEFIWPQACRLGHGQPYTELISAALNQTVGRTGAKEGLTISRTYRT